MAECRKTSGLNEQRNFKRIGSDSTVEVLFNGETPDLRVRFKDWSVAGACLMMDSPELLPVEFCIRKPRIGGDAPVVRCEIVWRRDEEVGVRFTRSVA